MIDPSLVFDAVLVVLRTGVLAGAPAPRRVGDHDAPDDRTRPYAVARIVPGGGSDGSSHDPAEMGSLVVQVGSVGDTRDQAQLHQWWMRQALMGRAAGSGLFLHAIEGAGWKVWMREHDTDGGVEGGGLDSPLFTAVDRYKLHVTPR